MLRATPKSDLGRRSLRRRHKTSKRPEWIGAESHLQIVRGIVSQAIDGSGERLSHPGTVDFGRGNSIYWEIPANGVNTIKAVSER